MEEVIGRKSDLQDSNELVFPGTESTVKKGELCKQLADVATSNNIKDSQLLAILLRFKFSCPTFNLPIEGKYSSREYSGAKLSINKYQSNDSSCSSLFLPFDVCMGNDGKCIGNYTSPEHFNDARCSIMCNAKRYKMCTQTSCAGKKYDECQHNRQKYGVPISTVYYRPIRLMLESLLEKPLFADYLNYTFQNPSCLDYMDVCHGQTFKKNVRQMDLNYNSKFSEVPPAERPIKINVLLSIFYDGIQINESQERTTGFWPLFATILNLPPTFRNKLDIGSFIHIKHIFWT